MRVDGRRVRADWDAASGRLTHLPAQDLDNGKHTATASWAGRSCSWGFVARVATPGFLGVGLERPGTILLARLDSPRTRPTRWTRRAGRWRWRRGGPPR